MAVPAEDARGFFGTFLRSKSALLIFLVSLLLAVGIGSVIGLIPDETADRYARIHHGYNGAHCSSFDRVDKPAACQEGSDDAQAAAAWSNVALSLLSLTFNPVVGSISDSRGRRGMIALSVSLSILPALVLVVMVHQPTFNPLWFFIANSLGGVVNYLSLIFASLSDIFDEELRTAANGLILAAFYGGYALAPSIPLFVNHTQTAMISLALIVAASIVSILFLPETLPIHRQLEHFEALQDVQIAQGFGGRLYYTMTRPLREVSILNRKSTIRLVAAASFFSAMVFASDATLVLYYIEDQLNVREHDIATMFFSFGLVGIALQGGLLQPMIKCFGEKGLLILTFVCGTLHNMLYGIAKSKEAVFVALIVSQFTKLNFPILSSFASKQASPSEQGRIQGALFAINSIAYATGPLSMEYVYSKTKNSSYYGPGFMFIYAAFLYFVGTILVTLLPSKKDQACSDASSSIPEVIIISSEHSELEEPLLDDHPDHCTV